MVTMTATAVLKRLSIPLITLFAIGGILVASGSADAVFQLSRNDLRATGTVVDVESDLFVMDTGGSEPPFEVKVDSRTRFRDGYSDLEDMEVGDDIEVRARVRNGMFIADRVEFKDGGTYGYGNSTNCERLRVTDGKVISVTSDEVVVKRDGIDITVEITDDTRVRGYRSDRTVSVGDNVDIRGDDCGVNGFTAERITIRRP